MNATLEWILRILGLLFAGAGLAVVYAAPRIVDKRGLAERKTVDPRLVDHYSPEEQAKFKRDSAILDIKLRGLLLAAPGFVLILIAFS
jgi:hypothetical protein